MRSLSPSGVCGTANRIRKYLNQVKQSIVPHRENSTLGCAPISKKKKKEFFFFPHLQCVVSIA